MTDERGPGVTTRPTGTAGRARLVEIARHSAIVGIAGVVAGLFVGGIGSRVLMRIAAVAADDRVMGATTENGNRVGEITLGGTAALVIFVGIGSGLIGAIAFLISEPWLARAGRWHGLTFGGFLLAIGSRAGLNADNFDFFIVGNQELNVAMFLALFLTFGLLMPPNISRLERQLPAINPGRPGVAGFVYVALAVFGLQFLLLFFVQFFVDEALGGNAQILTGILLLGLTAAAATLMLGRLRGHGLSNRVMRLATASGYAFLAGAVLTGGIRGADDVRRILSL